VLKQWKSINEACSWKEQVVITCLNEVVNKFHIPPFKGLDTLRLYNGITRFECEAIRVTSTTSLE
jgi:hypothetical protein